MRIERTKYKLNDKNAAVKTNYLKSYQTTNTHKTPGPATKSCASIIELNSFTQSTLSILAKSVFLEK